MPPPTFVTAYVGPTPSSAPGTTSVTVAIGDTLVVYAGTGDSTLTLNPPSGGSPALTWTSRSPQVGTASTSNMYMWTSAPSTTAQTFNLAVTKLAGSTSFFWGYVALRFSLVTGIGASTSTHITGTGAPTLNIATTQPHTAVVVGDVDFVPASGTAAWRTNAGAFTAESSQFVASNMGLYGGFHADVATPATYAVGMTAPSGQTYSIIATELYGPVLTPPTNRARLIRASHW